MLTEELSPECCGELCCSPGPAVHVGIDWYTVLDDDRNLRVMIPELRTIVEVGGSADDDTVIRNQYLRVRQ